MTATAQTLSDEDREHLHLFRTAARQIREASIIDRGDVVLLRADLRPGKGPQPEYVNVTAQLLAAEPLRSLALSVRLVYQPGEPAHFGHICNILERGADVGIRPRVRELRRRYNQTLNVRQSPFLLFALLTPRAYSPREMFEVWLYYGAFHQDPSRRADYEALVRLGDVFPATVQFVVLRLSGRILDLDDVVADFLREPKVPRLGSERAGA